MLRLFKGHNLLLHLWVLLQISIRSQLNRLFTATRSRTVSVFRFRILLGNDCCLFDDRFVFRLAEGELEVVSLVYVVVVLHVGLLEQRVVPSLVELLNALVEHVRG